ncbi:hypothetical protein [Arthrobacter sp. NPDC056493]|uniref:hypothetical protein n=1 Tax=Arthrobacter sp. NPDC056493 TaxID=3345839 RepID=UPI00366DEF0B
MQDILGEAVDDPGSGGAAVTALIHVLIVLGILPIDADAEHAVPAPPSSTTPSASSTFWPMN